MKKKEQELLKEFNKKWSDERKIIEDELVHEIARCKAMTESMLTTVDELNVRKSMSSKEGVC